VGPLRAGIESPASARRHRGQRCRPHPPRHDRASEPRHDRASELDLWDCVDELVEDEEFSQAMAE